MDGNRHLTITAHDEWSMTAVNRNGVELTIDGKGEHGFTPLELLMAALGGCGAIDFALLMTKQRDPVTPFTLDVDGLKEDLRMQWMRVTYQLQGDPDAIKVERARVKTATDLCTVSRTLTSGCPVEHVVG
jgi:putative redox protein